MISLPALGVGIGHRPAFHRSVLEHAQEVDFLEVITEQYTTSTLDRLELARKLRSRFPIIPHGVNLSIGTDAPLDLQHLTGVAAFVDEMDPPWWSEHLCFTRVADSDIGQLTPLPFTRQAVEVVRRNVEICRQYVKRPLLLENITYYFQMGGSELSEADFLRAVLEEADCGLLLDVTNVYINAVNHGYDPYRFVDAIPRERVVQLHLAGGVWDETELLVDTHSEPVPEEVWQLTEYVCQNASVKALLLERDDNFPLWDEIEGELRRARQIWQKYL